MPPPPEDVETTTLREEIQRLREENRRLQARNDRLSALLAISKFWSAEKDFNLLLSMITQETCRVLGADRGSIFLLDPERRVLWSTVSKDLDRVIEFDASKGIAGYVVQSGKVYRSTDVYQDPRFNREIDRETGYRTRNMICAPLRTMKGAMLGTFQVLNKAAGDFTAEDEEIFLALAAQAAVAIENAMFYRELTSTRDRLTRELRVRFGFQEIVGASPLMQNLLSMARRVCDSSINILITGESGTGKDLLARTIHHNSNRAQHPYIPINCAALPETLLEAELFGIEQGVATGVDRREGKLELAHRGTLFLDEVGDMSLAVQAKVLRVLQDREVVRVGGKIPRTVDVRIIAATNRDLEKEITAGRFRRDLYYRLNVVHLHIPPLRRRPEDIPILIDRIYRRVCEREKKSLRGFTAKAREALCHHPWPGNVRELENEIERAVALADPNSFIDVGDLSFLAPSRSSRHHHVGSLPEVVEGVEREMIREALLKTKGNKSQAARLLGITREGLRKKMKRLAIDG
ncbi:MAG: sigma-54-dependent Fis family transcriptional regulator [Deltaproteobacteria bacterium]|nr:MAG: sigma-54-dependent Fis family transcriptional regulator [Deltaproteobacteria bacterium]